MAFTGRTQAPGSTVPTTSNAIVGSAAHLPYQERKFQCTKEDCQHLFNTLEEMKLHKKYDPEHFYCKRCDFDAEDWEDLTNHKVENMAPYIEGAAGNVKPLDDDLKHITCEFCGEDFKSFGGRKRHRQQTHPADQDITCPGCQGKFIRASHLIEHFERGHCLVIPAHIFHAEIQQKHIISQIMAAPHRAFQAPGLLGIKPPTMSVTDGGETLDQDAGGVSLMDHEDEAQMGGYRAMEAERKLPKTEMWPSISKQNSANLAESMRAMDIGDRITPADEESNEEGEEVPTESHPGSSSDFVTSVYEDDATLQATATKTSAMGGAGVWGSKQTSQVLFPNAKVTPKRRPKAGDWDAILALHAEESESSPGADLLKIAWWDPNSADYDISRFRHPVYEAFYCPFPACEDAMFGNSFDTQSDIEGHIKYCHTRTKFHCERCFKPFVRASALVAHVESTSKCVIKNTENFGKFLDEITGGFIKSKYVGEPKIYRKETALVKKGQPAGGIASTRFTAKEPRIW